MKTKDYNPSTIEVRFVEVLSELKEEINKKMTDFDVYKIENNTQIDNPTVNISLKDNEGDEHKIVLKVIQKPDEE